ncbi:aldo/keto reductase [Microbacterium paludicola]|uniref:aldo/keto reductase n=1 Tax=Microbacterium paludicola TaxID=300019 RepID=UPI0031E19224
MDVLARGDGHVDPPRELPVSGEVIRPQGLLDPADAVLGEGRDRPGRDAIERMRQVCRRFDTTLDVAAVRYSTRDPRFATTVIGMSSAARVAPNVAAATADLPDELFAGLEALVPPEELWLDRR